MNTNTTIITHDENVSLARKHSNIETSQLLQSSNIVKFTMAQLQLHCQMDIYIE